MKPPFVSDSVCISFRFLLLISSLYFSCFSHLLLPLFCLYSTSVSRWRPDIHRSKKKNTTHAGLIEVHTELKMCSLSFPTLPFPLFSSPTSLSASSPVPDGDDAFSASRQHRPSACGMVPVHLLWFLCQQSAARLPVQLPACHRRVCRPHLW